MDLPEDVRTQISPYLMTQYDPAEHDDFVDDITTSLMLKVADTCLGGRRGEEELNDVEELKKNGRRF